MNSTIKPKHFNENLFENTVAGPEAQRELEKLLGEQPEPITKNQKEKEEETRRHNEICARLDEIIQLLRQQLQQNNSNNTNSADGILKG